MMDPNPLPAGAQFTIRHGRQEAVIVELGAGLRAFSVDGFDVIDGYEAEEMCTMARGQLLIPWPNRLANGRYRFNGEDHQVPITEHGMKQNALHGLVRWVPWRALEQNQSKIVLGYRHFPEPGYPFHLDLKVRYELVATGLEVEFHATNPGGHRLPLAMGQHPYIRAGEGLIDDSILHAPAATYIEVDERQLPVDVRSVERTGFDFREPRRLGETILDYSFGDFERDSAGRAQISLAGPDRKVTVWMDQRFRHLMLFSGDTVPGRPRRGLGVEPMTSPPNALQSGQDLIILEPGEHCRALWGITVE